MLRSTSIRAKYRPLVNERLEDRLVLAPLLPDLVPWASPEQGYLHDYVIDGNLLRFSTSLANAGEGALEVRGTTVLPNGRRQVAQRIYDSDGGFQERLAGEFTFHPGHGHLHFDGYAVYHLRNKTPAGGVGEIVASSGKISYCLIDVTPYPADSQTPANYFHCLDDITPQGISPGWADVYHRTLPDQWINISTVFDGDYWLEITVDPENQLLESNEENNTERIEVTIENGPGSQGDMFESNDTLESASDLRHVSQISLDGLSIHSESDRDFYSFIANDTGIMDVTLNFLNDRGDLQLTVVDSDGNTIESSNGQADYEQISIPVTVDQTYFILVEGVAQATNAYDLEFDGPGQVGSLIIQDENKPARITDIQSWLSAPDLEITDLNLRIDRLEHFSADDLTIELSSPAGTHATILSKGQLMDGTRFGNTIIDDEATRDITEESGELSGAFYVPGDVLSVFRGENAHGTWTLHLRDRFNQGTLYDWSIQFTGSGELGDRFETNDSVAQATHFAELESELASDLTLHSAMDRDFFSFVTTRDGLVEASVEFEHAAGNVDLKLYDANLQPIAIADSTTDNESLFIEVNSGSLYYLEVFSPDAATNVYDLGIHNTILGDINNSGAVDARDITQLAADVAIGSTLSIFDLNRDQSVDQRDIVFLVEDILDTNFGDANLDRQVDETDFGIIHNVLFSRVEESTGDWRRGWEIGDFNFDGYVDVRDINIWNDNRTQVPQAAPTPTRLVLPVQAERRRPRAPLYETVNLPNEPHIQQNKEARLLRRGTSDKVFPTFGTGE